MYFKKNKREMSKFDSIKDTVSSKNYLTSLNVEKLKSVLSYFSYLQSTGEISDKAFETLVSYACSIFIENEVEAKVQQVLDRKFMQFFHSKFYRAEEFEDLETAIASWDISRLIRSK